MIEIRCYRPADEEALIALWTDVLPDAAPHNLPRDSLARKLEAADDLLLVAADGETLVGTVMGGYDGHRGWMYAVAVRPEFQRRGIGSALCRRLEELLIERGCRKLNLQVRGRNQAVVGFYEQLGFCVEDIVSLGKRLSE